MKRLCPPIPPVAAALLFGAAAGCISPVREVAFDVDGQLSFTVYDDPELLNTWEVLPDASVWVRDESGSTLDVAETNGEGFWVIDVAPGQAIDIGVWSEGRLPTVRRAIAPSTTAMVAVAIYPRAVDRVPVLMDQLAEVEGLNLPDSSALLAGERGALLVEPADPEAWSGAELTVTDTDGSPAPLVALTVTDQGYAIAADSPVDMLLVPELLPGRPTLTVTDRTGRSTTQTWTLAPGELIDGRDFALAGGL